mmetsp:Transcript_29712/g.58989  ORF Transcript_29712/g.58989 Transcript_29712/m.58989 type:complete len:401 (+) Transcript_29712:3728-4930(+)
MCDLHVFIHLVHRLPHQTKFDHRAVVFDKPRIRCPARRAQHRGHARFRLDRVCHQIGQRAGRRQETLSRHFHLHLNFDPISHSHRIRLRTQPRGQAVARMQIVKADIHSRPHLRRNDIGGSVSSVHRHNRQGGRIKVFGPAVQFMAGQFVHQPHHRGQRIVCTMRIGRMALRPRHGNPSRHRPTAANLHHVAHAIRAGRLSHKAHTHRLARVAHIVQQGRRTIVSVAFLITGDGQYNGPIGGRLAHKVHSRCGKGGHARFHIGGAPAIHHPVFDLCAKGGHGPVGFDPDGYHIRMPVKAKGAPMSLITPPGKKVANAAPVRPCTIKPGTTQQIMQDIQRALIRRRDRGAADQIGGQLNGVNRGHEVAFRSIARSGSGEKVAIPAPCRNKRVNRPAIPVLE